MATRDVSPDVIDALKAAHIEGARLILSEELDRPTYVAVAKAIEGAGGKWNRKAGAHVFDGDAADAIRPILESGKPVTTKQDLGQFDTPPTLAARLVDLADIRPGMKVYEPSAGVGNIVAAIIDALGTGASVFAHELDPKRHAKCRERHFRAFGAGGLGVGDFLAIEPNPVFDRVVMNPPFAPAQADIDHVRHAFEFLKPGGRLVAVMAAGVAFRTNAKAIAFRTMVARHGGTISDLSDNAFAESGTSVRTVVVTLDKTEPSHG